MASRELHTHRALVFQALEALSQLNELPGIFVVGGQGTAGTAEVQRVSFLGIHITVIILRYSSLTTDAVIQLHLRTTAGPMHAWLPLMDLCTCLGGGAESAKTQWSATNLVRTPGSRIHQVSTQCGMVNQVEDALQV